MIQQQQQLRPKYEVEPLAGKRTEVQYFYEEETHGTKKILVRKEREVELDAGYMLYTARGDSVRVSADELRRMGIDPRSVAPLIDDEGNEVAMPSLSRLAKARELVKQH